MIVELAVVERLGVPGGIGRKGGDGESGNRQANTSDQGEEGFHLVEKVLSLPSIGPIDDTKDR